MNEEFLQFVWKYGLFDPSGLHTLDGDEISVIHLGEHNADAGPDFLNARLKIGSTLWAGNIEIHIRSSDWFLHGHDRDKSYDNVILHVVYEYNQPVTVHDQEIPVLVLPVDKTLYERYRHLVADSNGIPCHNRIQHIDALLMECWLNSLVVERLNRKTDYIHDLLERNRGDWEEAFYIIVARAFGFGLNAVPFELLARSLPLTILGRHRNDAFRAEALLMGQAGFLEEGLVFPEYYRCLREEYMHLQKKYSLKPVGRHLWKFLRLRPGNFPTIRISQFGNLVCRSGALFSQVISCDGLEELRGIFMLTASDFWNSHYTFEKTSQPSVKKFGQEAFTILVINAVVPFMFIHGMMTAREDLKEKALSWLNELPAEQNRFIARWVAAGIRPASAYYSQALMQLSKNYCDHRHCLHCQIGAKLITSGIS